MVGRMNDAPSAAAPAARPAGHVTITPPILYFGTPVVLLSTENEDGSFNLAPMSSAWALGQVIVLGLGTEGQTAWNLRSRHDLVINVPAPEQWQAVERLAPLASRQLSRRDQDSRQSQAKRGAGRPAGTTAGG
jgi:flavin reductase (DIM6/NTAB) family NADH-FMN oxidoreductase RutF